MRTYSAKPGREPRLVCRRRFQFELGRLATRGRCCAGDIRRSTPHMDVGDFVVVVNASQVKLKGRKPTQSSTTDTGPGWAQVDRCARRAAGRP